MSVLVLSLVLMLLLFALLGAGVWIGIALGICGFAGILTTAATPPGQVLASALWGARARRGPDRAAALRLDGRDPVPHAAVARTCSAGLAPWLERLPGRLLHTNVIGCTIFAAVSGSSRGHLRDDRQDDAARAAQARLSREHDDRHARRRRHARPADPAVDHHDRLRRRAPTCRSRSCSSPASSRASCWRRCSRATSSSGRCSTRHRSRRPTAPMTLRARSSTRRASLIPVVLLIVACSARSTPASPRPPKPRRSASSARSSLSRGAGLADAGRRFARRADGRARASTA